MEVKHKQYEKITRKKLRDRRNEAGQKREVERTWDFMGNKEEAALSSKELRKDKIGFLHSLRNVRGPIGGRDGTLKDASSRKKRDRIKGTGPRRDYGGPL